MTGINQGVSAGLVRAVIGLIATTDYKIAFSSWAPVDWTSESTN